jgi:hypothetical protein
MPLFQVYVETLDRRSSFSVEWPAPDEMGVIAELTMDGGVDCEGDDGAVEFYPLAGIRKITIKAAEEETVDG